MALIKYDRSVIPACDVRSLQELRRMVELTHDIDKVGAYKVGAILAISVGLPETVRAIREYTDLPVIYDHQKGMTDIPDLGELFASSLKDAGIDALIGFPMSGPATQKAWTKSCKDVGLETIIGGEMTHSQYRRSDGGYLLDKAIDEIYLNAARAGVTDFVVPGNKPAAVVHYRKILSPEVKDRLTLYSPGFASQGGVISEAAKAAGKRWHAIVGRAIYGAKDIRAATKEMARGLLGPSSEREEHLSGL